MGPSLRFARGPASGRGVRGCIERIGKRLHKLLARSVGLLVALVAISAGTLAWLWNPTPLQVLRHASFDQYQRWHPRRYQGAPVRIIDIDDESLRRLGQWPWPRTRIAALVDRLQQARAAAIVFDVMFAEPDRTSPRAMRDLWPAASGLGRELALLPDHDEVLARVTRRGGVVLGFAVEQSSSTSSLPASKARFVVVGEPPHPFLHAFAGSVTSLPMLAQAAAGNGALTFVPDGDGVVRKIPLLLRQAQTLLPSLAAEALRVAQGARNYVVRTSPQGGVGLSELRIGDLVVPTTARGEVWIHYTGPVAARYIPAWKVLAGEVPAQELAGHILLVGTSAQGLMDLRFTPMGGATPGVEIHAQVLEQLLTGTGLERPSWAPTLEVLLIVVGGLLVGGVALRRGAALSLAFFATLVCALGAGAWHAFVAQGLLLDPLTPALGLGLTFVSCSIVRHGASERRQRWVKQVFSRYVSPNLVAHLIEHPDALDLGGHRRQCSFVFTDLSGFTSQMERMDPGQAMGLLNAYLDRMIAIAFSHQGTLDRIVGDAVAIMFSAPVAQADHQARALACALEMQRFASRYVVELASQGIEFCATRIGVHSGEVIVGNFGGSAIFDYRALGDPVNTAARLEGANKHLGTAMCVSEATLAGCGQAAARPIGRLLLKGKSHPLMVFEPADASPGLGADPAYARAFELMRQERPDALDAFEALARGRPRDPLVALHLKRLRSGLSGDLVELQEK